MSEQPPTVPGPLGRPPQRISHGRDLIRSHPAAPADESGTGGHPGHDVVRTCRRHPGPPLVCPRLTAVGVDDGGFAGLGNGHSIQVGRCRRVEAVDPDSDDRSQLNPPPETPPTASRRSATLWTSPRGTPTPPPRARSATRPAPRPRPAAESSPPPARRPAGQHLQPPLVEAPQRRGRLGRGQWIVPGTPTRRGASPRTGRSNRPPARRARLTRPPPAPAGHRRAGPDRRRRQPTPSQRRTPRRRLDSSTSSRRPRLPPELPAHPVHLERRLQHGSRRPQRPRHRHPRASSAVAWPPSSSSTPPVPASAATPPTARRTPAASEVALQLGLRATLLVPDAGAFTGLRRRPPAGPR